MCLIVGGVKLQVLEKKTPQVHLIIIKEWPKHSPPQSPPICSKKFYGWKMSQKLPAHDFKWVEVEDISECNESFIKSYNEESGELDVQYPENLHNPHNGLHFLPERMEIENAKRLVANLHDKEEYVIHIRSLKQVLNNGLILKKFIDIDIDKTIYWYEY